MSPATVCPCRYPGSTSLHNHTSSCRDCDWSYPELNIQHGNHHNTHYQKNICKRTDKVEPSETPDDAHERRSDGHLSMIRLQLLGFVQEFRRMGDTPHWASKSKPKNLLDRVLHNEQPCAVKRARADADAHVWYGRRHASTKNLIKNITLEADLSVDSQKPSICIGHQNEARQQNRRVSTEPNRVLHRVVTFVCRRPSCRNQRNAAQHSQEEQRGTPNHTNSFTVHISEPSVMRSETSATTT